MSGRRSPFRTRKTSPIAFLISFTAFALTALAATEKSTDVNANGETPFTGDRRPGILEPPSDIPTGENAHLYDFLVDSFKDDSGKDPAPATKDSDAISTSNSSATAAPADEDVPPNAPPYAE